MISFQTLGRSLLKYGKQLGQRLASSTIVPNRGPFSFQDVRLAKRLLPKLGRTIWRNRKPIIAATMVGYTGWKAGQGLIQGYNTNVATPEQMYNRASGYGQFGDESMFRNQGRMPSNHLGHQGLTLNLSRLRHR